jgi:hypothetical protein
LFSKLNPKVGLAAVLSQLGAMQTTVYTARIGGFMSEGKAPMIDKIKEKAVSKDAQIVVSEVTAEVISAEEQREYKLACEALAEDLKALDIVEQLLAETEGKVQLLQFGIARTLHNVHAKKLYRIEFETLDTFLEEKYRRSRQWGYNMLWYWGVCLVCTGGEKPLGLTERQGRPLVRLLKFPEELKALWDKVKDAPLTFDLSAEVSEKKAAMALAQEDATKESKKGTTRSGSHRGTSGKKKAEEQEAQQQLAERKAREERLNKAIEEQLAERGDEVKERLAEDPERDPKEVLAEIKEDIKQDLFNQENRESVLGRLVETFYDRNFGLPDDFDPEPDVFFEGETITQRCWHWAEVALDGLEEEANQLRVKWQEQDLDKEDDESDSEEEEEDEEDEDVLDEDEDPEDAADAAAIAEELRARRIKK